MGNNNQDDTQHVAPLGGGDNRPRLYWPSGVKLDSKIDGNSRPNVIWVLTWDRNTFFSADYYAHDLYMKKDGGTFLDTDGLLIESNLPTTQQYRESDGPNILRLGWASYRPAEIQTNTIYTVTFRSNPTGTFVDHGVADTETYGIRIPPTCIGSCLWIPTSWCSVAPGGDTIQLFNSSHPDGILPLGVPLGDCNPLYFLFIPVLAR